MNYLWGPVQLQIACLMFMFTVNRNRVCFRRAAAGILATSAMYFFLPLQKWATDYPRWQIFWVAFFSICIVYIHFCLQCRWQQAMYCATCALATQHVFCCFRLICHKLIVTSVILDMCILLVVYFLLYWCFAANLFTVMFHQLVWTDLFSVAIILIQTFGLRFGLYEGNENLSASVMYLILDIACCLCVLCLQAVRQDKFQLQQEKTQLEKMVCLQRQQYEITSTMIERINQHCHDIKHQLHCVENAMNNQVLKEYLETVTENVMIYDTATHTGNKALDVVLMEKGMMCREKHIQWFCMADGSKMDFMKPYDIYAIFGNLIDNAIEAVENFTEEEKRFIDVRVTMHSAMMMIEVENLYQGNINMINGFPMTNKKDSAMHGFGLRSVAHIAENYDGTFTVETENSVFRAKLMLPVPQKLETSPKEDCKALFAIRQE